MKRLILLALAVLICHTHLTAQESRPSPAATEIIQQSQSPKTESPVPPMPLTSVAGPISIPAGTSIEVESAYTVSSIDVKPDELLSFRVLIPVMVNGVVAIERGALVTARVSVAKRGGHWGKAGRLSWTMVDVVAADNSRIPLAPETAVRNHEWILLKPKGKNNEKSGPGQGNIRGKSHGGEVAAKTIISAAIFPPLAPLALMNGFRRGEDAVLPEGKRFVVVVRNESTVTTTGAR